LYFIKNNPAKKGGIMVDLTNKKILLIIAQHNFQDQEYEKTRQALEDKGALLTVASSSTKLATGKFGIEVNPELSLDEVEVENYDACCFIGGPGAQEFFDSQKAYEICQETVSENKILGAICIAPVILAKSGVLSGKKATVWASNEDRSGIEALEEGGAFYMDTSVEVDGKIITASGSDAATEFGNKIAEILTQ
jgi:protease I